MSTVRVFEIAREFGMDSRELISRMSNIGITADDHLTPLDPESVSKIRSHLASSPAAGVVEERVSRTVVRRRSRRRKVRDEAPAQAATAGGNNATAAAPSAGTTVRRRRAETPPEPAQAPEAPVTPTATVVRRAKPEPTDAISPEEVVKVTVPVSAPPTPAEVTPEPTPAEETAPEAPPTPVAEAPAEVAAEAPAETPVATEAPPAEAPAAEAEAEAEATPAAAQAEAPQSDEAAAEATEEKSTRPLPKPPSKPTMERAVVVTSHVSQKVAQAVARTRAEKGYDSPAPHMAQEEQRFRSREGGGPPDREQERRRRPGGRRLIYDKRRDHLRRRGLLEHDDIFRGGRAKKKRPKSKRSTQTTAVPMKESKRVVKMGEGITVGDLAQQMMVKSTQVIGKLMGLGVMATVNQTIDVDTATMVADEFGWRVESQVFDVADYIEEIETEDVDEVSRPPVITVMGHVDHGKTSLLDVIRKARVAEGEAGGITQHIGAYTVNLKKKGTLVFIDTPGHEAFTAMRARGAKATDIVILVVAADDGVMPQTIEAINHAREADVPIIVAVNKIDKSNANVDRVLTELSEHGLVPEEWGGETVVCKVSALKKQGIDNLLEMVLLQSELMELTANPKLPASGLVLEGRLERGRGSVATVLVQEGTLEVGDSLVSGTVSGRVRAMNDDRGKKVKKATPSMPVEVIGISGVPVASEPFYVVKDDKAASKIVEHAIANERQKARIKAPKLSLDSLHEMLSAGEVKELKLVVKADVRGSAEALTDALQKMDHEEVTVKVIHTGVGGITETDVHLASASNAIIIGFGVRPEAKAKQLAEHDNVDIRMYTVIYDALEDVRNAMAGLLAPVEEERFQGRAEVRMTFSVPKVGTVAGSFVTEGSITRNARARVIRDNVQVYEGQISSLKRFKNDAREVQQGYECGIGVSNFNDIKVGDIIETYEIVEIAATLD